MGQVDFSTFSDDGGDRPAAEARAVAGGAQGSVSDVVDASAERFPEATGTVEFAVTQVNYTVEGSGTDEYPVVHLFGRTRESEAEHVRVLGVEPYFYARAESLDADPVEEYDAVLDAREEDVDGEPFTSIRGDRLTKIVARTPRDVGRIRDDFPETYEADILFPNRFLIDNDIEGGVRVEERRLDDGTIQVAPTHLEPADVSVRPRINTFDIEVDDRRGFPEDGEEPIVCLASHDSYRNEYVLWLFDAPDGDAPAPGDVADHELLDGDADVEVRVFDAEEAMLDAFLDYVDETDADILTGWNFEDFDAPYFLDRLEVLDMDPTRLSRVGEVWRSNSDWGAPNVKGRVVFDLLYAYKRTQFTELDSYRLDDVGETELGVGKERYAGDIGDLWERDPERLLEYNLRDVELCVALDRKQEILAFWDEVRRFVGCKLEDATTPGDAVDMYVLHKAYGQFALPTKGQQEGEEFEGGAVFDPITGVKEMVSVLDLKSLYPMAMTTMNASPETKVDPQTYDGDTYVAPNGQHFRKEPDGIMREMIDELLSEREEKKGLRDDNDPDSGEYKLYDRQQQAVKVIMNSLYGVSGWDRFRLYDKESAAAITSTGREVIEFTERAAREIDKEVTYGDTDSVMLELGRDVKKEEAIAQSFEIEEHINSRYDEFAREELNAEEHRFQIEFEKLYRRFFQAGKKKRYAGHIVWKEGQDVDDIDIVGFEYQRSDIASITKRVQREVLERIVTDSGDVDELKEALAASLHDEIEAFRAGDVDLEDIAIPGGIGKRLNNYDTDTAHVRGAKYANLLLGTNFDRGSKPKRVYLAKNGVHPTFFDRIEKERGLDPQRDHLYGEFKRDIDKGDGVICFEYADQVPDEFEVDYDEMLEKTLKGPIERVIGALDLSWEEVRSGQEQTGLGQYV